MSKVSVFDQKWIDLVFEGRNKEYGAYQLRQESPRTTMIALFSGIALIGILVSIPVIMQALTPPDELVIVVNPTLPETFDATTEPLKPVDPPKPEPVEPTPQPQAAAPVSVTATVAHHDLVVSSTPSDDIPDTRDFTNANPGNETTPGNNNGTVVIGTNPGTGSNESTGTGGTGTGDEPVSSLAVDESPMFMGGMDDFYKKVAREFDLPPTEKEMTLRVYVSFIVEKDGTMSNIKVLKDPGYGMGKEAIRVLKSIKTKWKPGKKAGKEVRTAYNLPITVNVK